MWNVKEEYTIWRYESKKERGKKWKKHNMR